MFSDRWKDLAETLERCEYTTPDRCLEETQSVHLFHAFLLQTRESGGMVYIVQSQEGSFLANHLADQLMTSLQIPARGLIPLHQDLTLPLAIVMKKTDLLITLCPTGKCCDTLAAALIAKENEVPLITFSGGEKNNPLREQGDLNLYLNTDDEGLITTGQFFSLDHLLKSWPYETSLMQTEMPLLSINAKPQNLQTGRRL